MQWNVNLRVRSISTTVRTGSRHQIDRHLSHSNIPLNEYSYNRYRSGWNQFSFPHVRGCEVRPTNNGILFSGILLHIPIMRLLRTDRL